MVSERILVVRARGPREIEHLNAPVAPRGRGAEPEPLDVSASELSPRDLRDLHRDPNVVGAAPMIPLQLLQPRTRRTAADPPASSWGIAAVGADRSPYDGNGVTVAVLDTGIDADHPAFAGARGRMEVRDFTGEGPQDNDGHGTHCAGTIFGECVDGVRVGVAPGVRKALIGKVLGAGGSSNHVLVEAIEWAVRGGAQIVSMSLGIDFPGLVETYENRGYPTGLATSKALVGYRSNIELFGSLIDHLTRRASDRGDAVLFVAAAGNESRRDERPDYSIVMSPPAAAEGVLSVGALEKGVRHYHVAPYSNIGVRLCAPGSDILSASPGGRLATMSGTSMAAPHVAGVAALWAQKIVSERRRLGVRSLANALEGRATIAGLDPASTIEEIGEGLVQAPLQEG